MSSEDDPQPPASPPQADDSAALLGELDALLDRMMALPVNPAAEEPLPARREEKPPPDVPIIHVTEAAATPPPLRPSDDLYFQTTLPAHVEELAPPTRPPEPVALWNAEPAAGIEPDLPAPAEPPAFTPPDRPEARRRLQPLLWFNRGFERLTSPLGSVGQGLRHPLGRALLGAAGLLMMLAAGAVVVADCLGWTW